MAELLRGFEKSSNRAHLYALSSANARQRWRPVRSPGEIGLAWCKKSYEFNLGRSNGAIFPMFVGANEPPVRSDSNSNLNAHKHFVFAIVIAAAAEGTAGEANSCKLAGHVPLWCVALAGGASTSGLPRSSLQQVDTRVQTRSHAGCRLHSPRAAHWKLNPAAPSDDRDLHKPISAGGRESTRDHCMLHVAEGNFAALHIVLAGVFMKNGADDEDNPCSCH